MVNRHRLANRFLDMVRIPTPGGSESALYPLLDRWFSPLGLHPMRDKAGNLLYKVDGEGEALMLTAHMDTVVPCEGVEPVMDDAGIISCASDTILGADDKAGIAIILELLESLRAAGSAHRPLDILLTVREETGLLGAKDFDTSALRARMGIGLDSTGRPGTIIVSAPSQNSLAATIHGKAAHAGGRPEDGINAIQAAAKGIANMPLGRIDSETTANIGIIDGGSATNMIPALVTMHGEARSRDVAKLQAQTEAMVTALRQGAEELGAETEIDVRRMYDGYVFSSAEPIVALVAEAIERAGIAPIYLPSGGGSDGNVFNARGVSIVQLGIGMTDVHTTSEFIALDDVEATVRILCEAVAREN